MSPSGRSAGCVHPRASSQGEARISCSRPTTIPTEALLARETLDEQEILKVTGRSADRFAESALGLGWILLSDRRASGRLGDIRKRDGLGLPAPILAMGPYQQHHGDPDE
jgi:hypothetical protein